MKQCQKCGTYIPSTELLGKHDCFPKKDWLK